MSYVTYCYDPRKPKGKRLRWRGNSNNKKMANMKAYFYANSYTKRGWRVKIRKVRKDQPLVENGKQYKPKKSYW